MSINPYTPGAAKRPTAFVGRHRQFALLDSLVDQLTAGYPAEDFIFTGLRGMGKTVFLKEAQDRFIDRGWLCGYYEVRRNDAPGVAIAQIIADTYESVGGSSWFRKALGRSPVRLGGVTISAPAGLGALRIDPASTKGVDSYRDLYSLMTKLGRLAQDKGTGVVFLIDELQQFKKPDLEVLLQVSQRIEGLPIAIVGAGLPTLAEQSSRAGTYSERFSFESIGPFTHHEASEALAGPAAEFGVTIAAPVLVELLNRAAGYPYFLQLYASEVWRAAGSPSERPGFTITRKHLELALPEVQRKADAGIYRARYERASNAERTYLKAMAGLGDGSVSSGEIARVLGKCLAQLSTTRDRLIAKGVIHSPRPGILDFSAPGFGDYVRRRSMEDQ